MSDVLPGIPEYNGLTPAEVSIIAATGAHMGWEELRDLQDVVEYAGDDLDALQQYRDGQASDLPPVEVYEHSGGVLEDEEYLGFIDDSLLAMDAIYWKMTHQANLQDLEAAQLGTA